MAQTEKTCVIGQPIKPGQPMERIKPGQPMERIKPIGIIGSIGLIG